MTRLRRRLARADAPANIRFMAAVIEFRHRRDDTVWAVVASVGRRTRVAEIFPSRERALADLAWREQQVRAYSGLFQGCKQPAPNYTVTPIRYQDLPRAWTPLPALGFCAASSSDGLHPALTFTGHPVPMSGSITALYLLQSANSGSSTADLFSIISGQGGQAATDPIAALKSAETNQAKNIATQEKDPSTSRDISHFLSVVAKAPDLATLLNDPTARKVFLTANGLGDQTDYVALATKALSSDPSKTGNLASTLSDPRWLGLAQTYNFAANGLSKLKDSTVLSTITSGYAQVLSNQALDQTTPGLSAALDFRSRANTIKSVDQILGDSNLRKVVTTALGLPEQIAFQPIEAQEQAISSRLDITKFSDPAYVEQFTRRFLISNQSSNTSSSSFLA